MSEQKICRICLRTESKVYNYDRFQLKYYYEEVMALKVTDKDALPHYFCYECATLLHKFHKFKEKCYIGQKVLKEILWKGPITYEAVYKIDRNSKSLHSTLGIIRISERVKTYIVQENTDNNIDIDNESEKDFDIDYAESYSEHEENNDLDNNHDSDVHEEKVKVDEQKDEIIDQKNDEQVIPSPVTTFIGDEDEFEIKTEKIDERRNSECVEKIVKKSTLFSTKNQKRKSTITITPDTKKYKFNSTRKRTNYLDPKYWKKYNLNEEDAVREFRAKADDSKYVDAAFKCTECFRGFSKHEMLKRHIKLRHGEARGPFECRFCRMRFKWDCHLRRHMRQHYTKYKCLRCNLVCPLEHTAMLHEEYHSGIVRKCIHCDEEFRHMSTYYTHLRTHRSEFVCTICGASFVSQAGLNQHKKVKHINNEIESPDDEDDVNTFCNRCDIRFETRKAYEEHLFHSAMHTEGLDEENECDPSAPRKILGKKEKAKITKQLLKRNSGDEPPINVSRKRSKRMRRSHKKPTNCHQCGKHFDTQAACMKHHLAEHPRTSFFAPTERHICEICGASLAPGSVAVHQNMHTREKLYPCDICGRTFHASIGLKRHLVTHTGEKPFACTMCDKRFTQSNSMKLHLRTFHLKQPYPKRNRRKKKDEPQEVVDDSKSEEDDSDSLPEPEMDSMPEPETGIEPVPNMPNVVSDRHMPEENIHYLTLT